MKYYAAYGSNLNVEQMSRRCVGAKVVGTAFIDGYELLFKGSMTGSYLTIEPKTGGRVPVAIWAVNDAHEAALDRYEGYPSFYYKRSFMVPVRLTDGSEKVLPIFAYIMDERRNLGLPSAWYVDTCAAGYRYFGFNLRYLTNAIRRSAA